MGCESCKEQIPVGTCTDFKNSDCIYVSEELTCSGVQADTVLTTALKRLDEFICEVRDSVANTVALINIGTGAKLYKGISVIGEREIRTLTSTDATVDIVEGANTIDLSVTVDVPEVPAATEILAGKARIATQAEADAGTDDVTIITPLKLKTYVAANGDEYTIQIVAGNLEFLKNATVISTDALPTGTDKFVTSFTIVGTSLVLGFNDATEISKDISSLINFTQVQADVTMENPASASYIKNRNPSKTVFADYTLTTADNNYVIVVDSATAVTITVPNSLPDKHFTGFIQKGTGLVTIANVDIIPTGLANTLKGKGHQGCIEKIEGIKFLFGNLNKAV